MLWLWITISCLMIIIFILLLKLYLLQKSAREIETAFNEKLITDSNTLIDISSKDKYMRHLANSINTQLRTLRKERHYFSKGPVQCLFPCLPVRRDSIAWHFSNETRHCASIYTLCVAPGKCLFISVYVSYHGESE